jgi:hypothetical protein
LEQKAVVGDGDGGGGGVLHADRREDPPDVHGAELDREIVVRTGSQGHRSIIENDGDLFPLRAVGHRRSRGIVVGVERGKAQGEYGSDAPVGRHSVQLRHDQIAPPGTPAELVLTARCACSLARTQTKRTRNSTHPEVVVACA